MADLRWFEPKKDRQLREFLTHNADSTESKPLTVEDFHAMLEAIYRDGASPDFIYFDEPGVDRLYRLGRIPRREYVWLKLRFKVGRLKRSVLSGVRSVLRITGSARTK